MTKRQLHACPLPGCSVEVLSPRDCVVQVLQLNITTPAPPPALLERVHEILEKNEVLDGAEAAASDNGTAVSLHMGSWLAGWRLHNKTSHWAPCPASLVCRRSHVG